MKFFSKTYLIVTSILIIFLAILWSKSPDDTKVILPLFFILLGLFNFFYILLFLFSKLKNNNSKKEVVGVESINKKSKKSIIQNIIIFIFLITSFYLFFYMSGAEGVSPIDMVLTYFLPLFIYWNIIKHLKYIKKIPEKEHFKLEVIIIVTFTFVFLALGFTQKTLMVYLRKSKLEQKNIVYRQIVCDKGGSILQLDIKCKGIVDRNKEYKNNACYSRLMPRGIFNKECTECLIICD